MDSISGKEQWCWKRDGEGPETALSQTLATLGPAAANSEVRVQASLYQCQKTAHSHWGLGVILCAVDGPRNQEPGPLLGLSLPQADTHSRCRISDAVQIPQRLRTGDANQAGSCTETSSAET